MDADITRNGQLLAQATTDIPVLKQIVRRRYDFMIRPFLYSSNDGAEEVWRFARVLQNAGYGVSTNYDSSRKILLSVRLSALEKDFAWHGGGRAVGRSAYRVRP